MDQLTQINERWLQQVSWTDLVRLTNAELVEAGVPARKASALRRHVTGHQRSLHEPWWMSIGLWGRIYTASDIAHVLGVDVGAVQTHARGCGLRTAPPTGRTLQANLAATLYAHRDDPRVARHLGVMEVERRRYVLSVEAILGVPEFDFGQLGDGQWILAWAKQDLAPFPLGLPPDVAARRLEVTREVQRQSVSIATAAAERSSPPPVVGSQRWCGPTAGLRLPYNPSPHRA